MKHHFALRSGPLSTGATLMIATVLALGACESDGTRSTGPSPTPAIGVQLGSATLSVQQGQRITLPVNVACTGGYTGGVALSVTGVPSGVSMAFEAPFVAWGEWGTMLTIEIDPSTVPGTYSITVTGAGTGVASQSAGLVLTVTPITVPSIEVGLLPAWLSIVQGQIGSVAVTVTRNGDFNGDVALEIAGAPSGVTAAFDPQVMPAGTHRTTLTVSVGAAVTPGTYSLTVSAAGSGVGGRSASLTMVVVAGPTPAISVWFIPDDEFAWTLPGDSWRWDGVVVTRRPGYAGTVSLSIEGLPPKVTAAFDPSTLGANETTSAVTFTAAPNAAIGGTWVTIRATGDGVPDATTVFRLFVLPPAPTPVQP